MFSEDESRRFATIRRLLIPFVEQVKDGRSNPSQTPSIQNSRVSNFTEFRSSIKRVLCQSFGEHELLPSASELADVLDDPVAMALYQQLYYQRFFEVARSSVDVSVYVECLSNTSDLFHFFKDPTTLPDIPAAWFFSIVDEFVLAFEGMVSCLPLEDEYVEFSSPYFILNPLSEFVRICRVFETMEASKRGENIVGNPLYRALGYYCLVGLIRFHTCDGDYFSAMKLIDRISLADPDQIVYSGSLWKCVFSTDYYAAFCMLMSRRYLNAINICTDALTHMNQTNESASSRAGGAPTSNTFTPTIAKLRHKICHILAIVLNFFPYEIDDFISDEIGSVVSRDLLHLMKNGDRRGFSDAFLEAAPCFYSFQSVCPALETQAQTFMMEVDEQLLFSQLRSVLKNYINVPIKHIAQKLKRSPTETIELLTSLKHKIALPYGKAAKTIESYKSSSKLDFYIDGDMVRCSHATVVPKYATMMAEEIVKLHCLQHIVNRKEALRSQTNAGTIGFR